MDEHQLITPRRHYSIIHRAVFIPFANAIDFITITSVCVYDLVRVYAAGMEELSADIRLCFITNSEWCTKCR